MGQFLSALLHHKSIILKYFHLFILDEKVLKCQAKKKITLGYFNCYQRSKWTKFDPNQCVRVQVDIDLYVISFFCLIKKLIRRNENTFENSFIDIWSFHNYIMVSLVIAWHFVTCFHSFVHLAHIGKSKPHFNTCGLNMTCNNVKNIYIFHIFIFVYFRSI